VPVEHACERSEIVMCFGDGGKWKLGKEAPDCRVSAGKGPGSLSWSKTRTVNEPWSLSGSKWCPTGQEAARLI
jgi:hypothetical protein